MKAGEPLTGGPPGETDRDAAEEGARGGRVGILGGAFDPPHLGHVELARTALASLGLDRLLVMVVGQAPHKRVDTPPEIRFRLAAAAFADVPRVEVSPHELERPGPSYTVDTARWAASRFDEAVWIVGADQLADLPTWRDPGGVLEHVRLAVAARPGFDRDALEPVLERVARADRIEFFDLRPLPIASRDIRARVARREPIDHLVPAPVAALVEELGLYLA